MSVGDAGYGGRERPPQWANPEGHREEITDPDTDKETLEDLETEADKRDRGQLECRWGRSYGDADTQTRKKHRGKETRSLILSASFLKRPLITRHCSRCWT